MKIAIMGAGAFGTALGGILANKGYDIDYYDRKIEQEKLSDVLDGAKIIVLCVPSEAAPFLLPHLPTNLPLIIATKGILSDTAFKNFSDYMVISGPGFANDIKDRKQTKLTATDKRVVELFGTDYLTFDITNDEKGVLMCGSLKNVYAILAGIKRLERDTSEWNSFVNEVVAEMKKILVANGARSDTVDLACGISDLKLTCGFPSRNYEFGYILNENPDYKPEKTVEGVTALKKIKRGEITIPTGMKHLEELISRSEKWA